MPDKKAWKYWVNVSMNHNNAHRSANHVYSSWDLFLAKKEYITS